MNKANRFESMKEFSKGGTTKNLISLAEHLFKKQYDSTKILEDLKDSNTAQGNPPVSDNELKTIIEGIQAGKLDSNTYKEGDVVESKYMSLRAICEREAQKIDWVWQSFIARGFMTLLSGLPKAGKSTLLFFLLKALMTGGSFFNKKTKFEGKILIVSEEHSEQYRERMGKEGLFSDNILILPAFEVGCHSQDQVLKQIKMSIRFADVTTIVLDTLGEFWGVKDENDSSSVQLALKPFREIAQELNIAVLLIHHLRKSEGDNGTAHRGSGALLAGVDIGLELNYCKGNKTKRTLTSKSRFNETPTEIVIEKTDDDYKCLGDSSQFERENQKHCFIETLTGDFEELEVIRKRMKTLPGKTLAGEIAGECFAEKLVERLGKGKKGDPYKYREITLDG